MSVSIPNKSFIALMGPSGCGKTTLLNALNGDNPATSGRVYIHGLELSKNYNILKRRIGYVPQSDIVHMELTVEESLFYAAKLRMPDDTTDSDITERITEVLNNLKINDKHIRENKVSKLSGGQRKRVSIAVELLNNPTILFLDEPTSPLDPETIEEFLICLKELTEQGTTVVMVTHKPSDLEFVDRVIFMATKGYHCFYGDKADIESHFGAKNLIQVYSMLSIDERKNETEDKVELWYNKWYTKQKPQQTTEDSNEIKKDAPQSMSRQFYWLAKRYLNIKLNDRQNLFLLLAQPIIIGGLLAMIFQKLQLGVLFMMAISAIWFGVSNAAKEIVGELPIYRRERMFNLNIITYLMSKITILALIAFVQVLIFVLIVYARYVSDEIGVVYFWKYVAFMFYLAVSATLVGLQLSSLFKTTEQVMTVVPMALMPQIILAGVITRIDESWKELLSYLTLGRWGTEGFARIQDSDPKFKQIDTILSNPVKDTIYGETYNIPGQDPIKMVKDIKFVYEHTDTTTIRSVYTTTPDLIKDKFIVDAQATEASLDTIGVSSGELIYQKTSALSQLDFYNDKLMGIFNSFEQNLLIITIINIVVFAGLFVAMKKKDNL